MGVKTTPVGVMAQTNLGRVQQARGDNGIASAISDLGRIAAGVKTKSILAADKEKLQAADLEDLADLKAQQDINSSIVEAAAGLSDPNTGAPVSPEVANMMRVQEKVRLAADQGTRSTSDLVNRSTIATAEAIAAHPGMEAEIVAMASSYSKFSATAQELTYQRSLLASQADANQDIMDERLGLAKELKVDTSDYYSPDPLDRQKFWLELDKAEAAVGILATQQRQTDLQKANGTHGVEAATQALRKVAPAYNRTMMQEIEGVALDLFGVDSSEELKAQLRNDPQLRGTLLRQISTEYRAGQVNLIELHDPNRNLSNKELDDIFGKGDAILASFVATYGLKNHKEVMEAAVEVGKIEGLGIELATKVSLAVDIADTLEPLLGMLQVSDQIDLGEKLRKPLLEAFAALEGISTSSITTGENIPPEGTITEALRQAGVPEGDLDTVYAQLLNVVKQTVKEDDSEETFNTEEEASAFRQKTGTKALNAVTLTGNRFAELIKDKKWASPKAMSGWLDVMDNPQFGALMKELPDEHRANAVRAVNETVSVELNYLYRVQVPDIYRRVLTSYAGHEDTIPPTGPLARYLESFVTAGVPGGAPSAPPSNIGPGNINANVDASKVTTTSGQLIAVTLRQDGQVVFSTNVTKEDNLSPSELKMLAGKVDELNVHIGNPSSSIIRAVGNIDPMSGYKEAWLRLIVPIIEDSPFALLAGQ